MNWHRLFGLVLMDFFSGSPFEVELEKDLSIKKQLLDVIVVRRTEGTFEGELPDGMENLADHNLISFKSHQETLDAWTINELIGHYVNYRKQVSPSMQTLLPENVFRLFCVSARYPQSLASVVQLQELSEGVYQCHWGADRLRILVANRLPEQSRNAMLHLFSADGDRVQYGRSHYHQHTDEMSTVLGSLITGYREEGLPMPYTMEDFKKEIKEKVLSESTTEELLERIPPEERLKGLSIEEIQTYLNRLKSAPTEESGESAESDEQTEPE